MYLITTQSGLIIEIATQAYYIQFKKDYIISGVEQNIADAIYSEETGKYYRISGNKKLDLTIGEYQLIEIDEIPSDIIAGYWYYSNGEFYTTEEKQIELLHIIASNNVFTMLVDQEYRLMLLELEVR